MEQEIITATVFNVLKHWDTLERGYWPGMDALFDDLEVYHNLYPTLQEVKTALKVLREKGLIEVLPTFNESTGLLNGSGYFYKHDKPRVNDGSDILSTKEKDTADSVLKRPKT